MSFLPVRLIATDVDGTLFNDEKEIPPDNLRAIKEAQQAGIVVAIASGRFHQTIKVMLDRYGLSCPIIGSNGGTVVDENLKVLSEHFMEKRAAKRVKDALEEAGAEYYIYGKDCVCTAFDGIHFAEIDQKEAVEALGFKFYHGREEARACVKMPVLKYYVCNNVPLDQISETLSKIPGIELTRSGTHNLEVMPRGVNKGIGVRDMAASLGISMTQVMTLGDEDNDIPMLRIAGYGVAMANAVDSAKAAAAFVTASNEESGLARAIDRYALQKKEPLAE